MERVGATCGKDGLFYTRDLRLDNRNDLCGWTILQHNTARTARVLYCATLQPHQQTIGESRR